MGYILPSAYANQLYGKSPPKPPPIIMSRRYAPSTDVDPYTNPVVEGPTYTATSGDRQQFYRQKQPVWNRYSRQIYQAQQAANAGVPYNPAIGVIPDAAEIAAGMRQSMPQHIPVTIPQPQVPQRIPLGGYRPPVRNVQV